MTVLMDTTVRAIQVILELTARQVLDCARQIRVKMAVHVRWGDQTVSRVYAIQVGREICAKRIWIGAPVIPAGMEEPV